jgi:hypothetical protein
MSFEELRVIIVVYSSALIPLIYLLYSYKKLPAWVPLIYITAFIACALGWEVWFTYGLVDGDAVDLRRSAVLSSWIPLHLNWFSNSLADAGTVTLGGFWLMWWMCFKDNQIFSSWSWKAFGVFYIWCICQNIFVELFLYHDQLADGKLLSWTPLAPLGSYLNPELFSFNGRSVMLQTQIPWIILPALI